MGALQGCEPANRCEDRIEDVVIMAERGVRRIRSPQGMLFGFLRYAGLYL